MYRFNLGNFPGYPINYTAIQAYPVTVPYGLPINIASNYTSSIPI